MKKAVTLIELLISVSILIILFSAVILLVQPQEQLAKARDNKKLSDISKFDVEINDYKIDNGAYPDLTPPPTVSYYKTSTKYELNVDLEHYIEKEQNDGGNDENLYEIGNDLTIN